MVTEVYCLKINFSFENITGSTKSAQNIFSYYQSLSLQLKCQRLQGKDKEYFEPRRNVTSNWKYAQLSANNVFLSKTVHETKKWTEYLLVLEISIVYYAVLIF